MMKTVGWWHLPFQLEKEEGKNCGDQDSYLHWKVENAEGESFGDDDRCKFALTLAGGEGRM